MGVRHLQVVFGWMATTLGYVLRADMSVAVIAMTDDSKSSDRNVTDIGSNITFPWEESQKNLLLSSFFWLYMVFAVPSGQLAEKLGPKLVLGLSIGLASLCTLLIPIAAIIVKGYEFEAILTLRILNGVAQSAIFPTTVVLISRWVTPSERSRSLALCFSGGFFGPLIGFPLAGFLAGSAVGWPAVFCATGGLGLIWTVLWIWLGGSSYQESRIISEKERDYIHEAVKNDMKIQHTSKTPWIQIFTSLPVWAIIISHFGFNFAYFFLLTEAPNYMHSVLKEDVKNSGLLNTLPFVMGCVSLPVYSIIKGLIEKYTPISHTNERKVWNTITLWGGALPIFVLAIFDVKSTLTFVVLLIISITCLTAEYYGYLTNHIHLSPNFAGTLLGISNTVATFGSLLPPLCTDVVVADAKSMDDWKYMFFLVSSIMFIANLVYVIFGSSKLQSWNAVVTEDTKTNVEER